MTKSELIQDIKKRCCGKCGNYLLCILEIKDSDDSEIKDYNDLTQCRFCTDAPIIN